MIHHHHKENGTEIELDKIWLISIDDAKNDKISLTFGDRSHNSVTVHLDPGSADMLMTMLVDLMGYEESDGDQWGEEE